MRRAIFLRRWTAGLLCTLVMGPLTLSAADISIVKSGAAKSAISLSSFAAPGPSGSVLLATLRADLERSGWFTIAANQAALAVSGRCTTEGSRLAVDCTVANVAQNRSLMSKKYREDASAAVALAHRIADDIVMAVKGVPGIASTRIVMVGSTDGRKDLYACGADGRDMVRLTADGAVCLSPKWAPDAASVVYTSFHGGYPDIYRLNIDARTRQRISGFPGMNTGADISPDGRRMAVTLSKDGNPDLYVMDLKSRKLTRITRTRHAAEASPSWSPDGRELVFVSDQAGSPQLYVVDLSSGRQRRLTHRGTENVAPDWGSGGQVAFSSRREGRYHICVIDPGSGREVQLTSDYVDHEDPSWAPDGRHIVYSRTEGYRASLYILDTLGDPPIRLTTLAGDWYFPDWSPQ